MNILSKNTFIAAALTSIAFTAPASAQNVAITGGKLVIGDGSDPIENGTVVIKDGKVVAAGENVAVPANMREIDADGKWITPGIFAGFSRVGLVEVGAVSSSNDTRSGDSGFSAGLDVAPSISPYRSSIAVSRAAGVTRAVVAPSGSGKIFAGQGAIADLGADDNPVTKARAFQFVQFGTRGAAIAGGSRTALHTHFRAMLREAGDHAAGRADFDNDLLTKEDAKALRNVASGKTRLLVEVHGANDILRLLELKRDFPKIKMVLVGASEGWRVAKQLKAAGVPVIASALNDLPRDFAQLGATQSNIGRMQRAGVKVAIGLIDDGDTHQLRYTPQYAGNLVSLNKVPRATGLSWNEAFAAITSKPAEIMGVGNRLGSLKAGRVGDVVLWDGDPLELSSTPTRIFIDGVEQSLDNRQARLRERYRNPVEGDLPKAYDR